MEDKIRGIHLESLIDQLIKLWHMGVDYVDISKGRTEEEAVVFSFSKEYLDPESVENFDKMWDEINGQRDETPTENKPKIKITKDNIGDLI